MQSHIGHIQFNVEPTNLPFYRELAAILGWQTLHDTAEFIGIADPNGTSLWFIGYIKPMSNDYDGPGMNHLGFSVPGQADVDAAAAFLTDRGVAHLFETPRHRPDFARGEDSTYYQVMFESPDRILFEIVYSGPKARA
jgi:catechol 2,3-dioxygenase-like lactoylglutathione lyase family enzyme